MANCKECIHSECCFMQYGKTEALKWQSELGCKNFKDRSRFVELPCAVGDTVYYIVNINGEDTISSAVVDEVAIYKSGTIGYDCGVGEIGFSSKSIGKRVFLTQAEAEQTLAKRNQPDNIPQ